MQQPQEQVHPILQRKVRRYSALDAFRLQQTLPLVQPAPAPCGPGRPRLIGQSGLSMLDQQQAQQARAEGAAS